MTQNLRMGVAHTQSFEEAISVNALSSNSYSAHLSSAWSIGDVPHGGYLLAIAYRAVCTHFRLNHPNRHAGHAAPVSMQLCFLRPSQVGPARLEVNEAKLGSRVSTVTVTLSQPGGLKVMGLVTVSNFAEEAGLSAEPERGLDALPHLPPPQARTTAGQTWERARIPHPEFRKAPSHVEVHVLAESSSLHRHGTTEQWARLRWEQQDEPVSGRWTNEAAAFLLDVYPSALATLESKLQSETGSTSPVWFPTLTISIDFKKQLPVDGEEWLHSCVSMMQVKNGRTDIQVVLRDALGQLVALASQVGLAMSSGRRRRSEHEKPRVQHLGASPNRPKPARL
ncbi:thioesterase-like superfamily-domain-containing protein [Dactylonectria estremocensis]|uniref:Thioesterase-like superfamily-domain-containing protein n=1 Tax=Dactylonectria estremocensis TaxID=1079267 RepID=A0A9P9IMC8_9HYPO|nr:thioesterase-like superfamily-domain-containing protein [Dactylonectria estremocensis]